MPIQDHTISEEGMNAPHLPGYRLVRSVRVEVDVMSTQPLDQLGYTANVMQSPDMYPNGPFQRRWRWGLPFALNGPAPEYSLQQTRLVADDLLRCSTLELSAL